VNQSSKTFPDQVDYVSGRTRLFGIVGHPICAYAIWMTSYSRFPTSCERALVDRLGEQAHIVGTINALGRNAAGGWRGDIFDGIGCVDAFRRRDIALAGRRMVLLGAGGPDRQPQSRWPPNGRVRCEFDVDAARAQALGCDDRACICRSRGQRAPQLDGIDVLLNATPAGTPTSRAKVICRLTQGVLRRTKVSRAREAATPRA
jgi:hypothetical protein